MYNRFLRIFYIIFSGFGWVNNGAFLGIFRGGLDFLTPKFTSLLRSWQFRGHKSLVPWLSSTLLMSPSWIKWPVQWPPTYSPDDSIIWWVALMVARVLGGQLVHHVLSVQDGGQSPWWPTSFLMSPSYIVMIGGHYYCRLNGQSTWWPTTYHHVLSGHNSGQSHWWPTSLLMSPSWTDWWPLLL
jgi:hypothetical protein